MSRRLEDDLQVACVTWFKYQYPKHIITSFPAGFVFGGNPTKRAITGKRMKEMGYLNGIPDLFIAHPNGTYSGLFVELKVGRNKPTDSQKEVMEMLEKSGYKCEICYCVEEFRDTVKNYIK